MLNQTIQLSPTVEQVQRKLIDEKAVFAIDIVQLIIEHHPEYSDNASATRFSAGTSILQALATRFSPTNL
jgi:hypothetical protein